MTLSSIKITECCSLFPLALALWLLRCGLYLTVLACKLLILRDLLLLPHSCSLQELHHTAEEDWGDIGPR